MASVLDLVKHYQHNIEKYPDDERKILKAIEKLFQLDVKVQHLQETGVGRTVNALRKEPGHVGKAARALVYKWKLMVAAEESDQEGDHESALQNGHGSGKDSDDGQHSQSRPEDRHMNGDHSGAKRKYHSSEDEEPHKKKSRHSHSSDSDDYKKHHVKEEPQSSNDSDSHSDNNVDSELSDEEEKPVRIKTEPVEKDSKHCIKTESSSSKLSHESEHHSLKHSKHSDRQNTERPSKSSHNSDEKRSKDTHKNSDRKHREHKSEKEKAHKEKEESRQKEKEESRQKEKEERARKEEKSRKEKEEKSHKEREASQSSSKHSSEKHRSSSSQKDSSSDRHKNHGKSKSDHEKKKSEKHSSSKNDKNSLTKEVADKHKSQENNGSTKDKSTSDKEKYKDSSKDKERSSSHSSKSDKKNSSSKSRSDSKSKSSDETPSEKSERKSSHKSSSSDKSKSSSSKSKQDKPKKKIQETNEDSDDGIGCESGASFAEALGMVVPTKPKKKQSSTPIKDVGSPSSSVTDDLSPAALLAPTAKLAPLPAIEISALPEISPNYKPRPPPKFQPHFNEEEAMNMTISSKNARTKVFSGTKTIGKIPSLYEMCVYVLQEHIDALEYTGGVPYEILKPVVDRATPQQLFMLEHYNPYLMEDTDHLWQKFCEKHFRNKKRQEMESWREMYMRCQEEQEQKLKSLTANIRMTQEAKKAPIKQTKMAYVDSLVKPPRNIARKQAQHGTARAAAASPAARVASLAGASNVLRGGVRAPLAAPAPLAAFSKPKKAPLMQKALQFMRGRKR